MALSFNARTLIHSDAYTWNGGSHQPVLVTFSFATAANGRNATTSAWTSWGPFSEAQRQTARQAMNEWGDISGIHFVEVPDTVAGNGIDLRFQFAGMPSGTAGQAYYPTVGDISLSLSLYEGADLSPGSYGYLVLLHEVGHALGLKHPFEGNPVLPDNLNNFDTTVMAYPQVGFSIPDALRAADVEAIQYLYGTQQDEASFGIRWRWDARMSGIRHEGDDRGQAITGTALRDIILGQGGDDILRAGAGDDVVGGGGGYNTVYGDAGTDTLVTELYRAEARLEGLVTRFHPGTFTELSGVLRGPGEHTTFSGIEAIAYADGRLAFNETDPVAQVTRMYQAALGRQPEAGGREFWTRELAGDAPLSKLAGSFLGGKEFEARFGTPDDASFVTRAYQQALGRDPDAGGLKYWTGQLNQGMSRAELLAGFSESQENRNSTAWLLSKGLWDADDQMAGIARLYKAVLGRAPDAGGLRFWDAQADQGTSLNQMANQFAQSHEFNVRFPSANDPDFVSTVYLNTLGRAADAGGLTFWTNRMQEGMTRGDIVEAFSASGEFLNLTSASIDNGIVFA